MDGGHRSKALEHYRGENSENNHINALIMLIRFTPTQEDNILSQDVLLLLFPVSYLLDSP